MSAPDDGDRPSTEPSPAPTFIDGDVADAIASDLETLEGVARGLGDGIAELSGRLRAQLSEARRSRP